MFVRSMSLIAKAGDNKEKEKKLKAVLIRSYLSNGIKKRRNMHYYRCRQCSGSVMNIMLITVLFEGTFTSFNADVKS